MFSYEQRKQRKEYKNPHEAIFQMISRINAGAFVNIENMNMREIPPDPDERSFYVRGY